MKLKQSISVEGGVLREIKELVRKGEFRSTSQFFEQAIKRYLEVMPYG
ncbi:MAG: ribbon-helix-helix protein, CopG family [DPANN group archaeon]|nr:ribbon-helix-helix protein, CopG family [DPANN group archaeon]